jgi:two-component system, sensor histidine kinase ChiS
MISKNKNILVIALSIIIIVGFRLVWLNLQMPFNHPHAVNGVLDLRNIDIPSNQTIRLNGQWEFYPSQFKTLQDDSINSFSANSDFNYIQAPKSWNSYFTNDNETSFRYGSYRLRILINSDEHKTYGLRINAIKNASAVYVNGNLLASDGQASDQKEEHKPQNIPYIVTIPSSKSNVIDIVIHVSNNTGDGGIVKPIQFGTYEAIAKQTQITIAMQFMLFVVLLFHVFYGAIIFFFGADRKVVFYFTLLVCFALLSVLVVDDKLLFLWLPISYEWQIKLLLFSYVGFASFLPPLAKNLFPRYGNQILINCFSFFCGFYMLFTLFTPSQYTLSTVKVLLLPVLVISVALTAQILIRALQNKEDVILLIISNVCITSSIIWGSVQSKMSITLIHYPFDIMFACLAFAAFWFKRFFLTNSKAINLTKQLQLADKQKDEFLVNTSHELRNPLHGIINIAQALLDDKMNPPTEKNKKSLEILITVGRRMTIMLDDLFDVTRLKERRVRLKVKDLRLQSIINGVLEILQYMIEGKPITIKIDIPDSFPSVLADENRLVQILFNLLHNAIKFTDEGEIVVSAVLQNEMASIHIRDTGIGISKEVQQKIFQPYEQGDHGSRLSGGFGLGLSICKELVELHGGKLLIHSSPGNGSEFIFTLPLSGESIEQDERDLKALDFNSSFHIDNIQISSLPTEINLVKEDSTSSSKPKILAVDDDVVNLKVIQEILGTSQYNITKAISGPEALSKLNTEQYDLIIADVMMPHMSGYELCTAIRKRFSITELPILLLTARNRSEDIYTGFNSGANDYVTKPVDAWELRSRVRGLTEMKQSVSERLRMEGAWLQSQIKPHFLFNTLNTIAALSISDTPKMLDMLEMLSDYLRASFDFHNSDQLVSIDNELDLVRAYLFIEKERFGERLEVFWDLNSNIDLELPPLSIQTLIENAIRHGILPRNHGGKIWIEISDSHNYTEISIRDNGVGMNSDTLEQLLDTKNNTSNGIGLLNTDRRLKQIYGKGLQIQSIPNQGTTVSFYIPK